MGHLINPIATRLGWFTNWCDSWFSDFVFYPEMLHHVFRIRLYLVFFFSQFFFIDRSVLFSHFSVHYKSNFLFVNVFIYDGVWINDIYTFYDDYLELIYPAKNFRRSSIDDSIINMPQEILEMKRKIFDEGLGVFSKDGRFKLGSSLKNREVGFIIFILLFLFSRVFPFEFSYKFFSGGADIIQNLKPAFWIENFDFKFFFSSYYLNNSDFLWEDFSSAFSSGYKKIHFEYRFNAIFFKWFILFINSPFAYSVYLWKYFKKYFNKQNKFGYFILRSFSLPKDFHSKLAFFYRGLNINFLRKEIVIYFVKFNLNRECTSLRTFFTF